MSDQTLVANCSPSPISHILPISLSLAALTLSHDSLFSAALQSTSSLSSNSGEPHPSLLSLLDPVPREALSLSEPNMNPCSWVMHFVSFFPFLPNGSATDMWPTDCISAELLVKLIFLEEDQEGEAEAAAAAVMVAVVVIAAAAG
ncbi:hypothetical protein PanWU01x14_187820 [Parasponia andersonii]|uniref:Uncharacterized protein n=1 Tax=Parasponia andersonii TaxID=3476 RepID=A0A2P5C348_PARAD|nr:hypothetical protein PanWU01x14_187820 [Parasponia andersonii]